MGKEICRAYAAAGCNIIIASRKLETCEALARQIMDESPGRQALPFAMNVNSWDDCERLFTFAYDSFGKVDILVNNAGGSPLYKSLLDVSEDYYDKVMDLNLKGPFRLSVLFASRMCEQDGGKIINVSTANTMSPSPHAAVYGAAKSGVNYLTSTLAAAYGPKVRVNCIMPGPFLTDISKAWDVKQGAKQWRKQMALMRAGRADEVVGAALYFASEASSFTTGAILQISGLPSVGARDPYHSKNLDLDRDVIAKMRDPRISKL